jgi:hypothetical protein
MLLVTIVWPRPPSARIEQLRDEPS